MHWLKSFYYSKPIALASILESDRSSETICFLITSCIMGKFHIRLIDWNFLAIQYLPYQRSFLLIYVRCNSLKPSNLTLSGKTFDPAGLAEIFSSFNTCFINENFHLAI